MGNLQSDESKPSTTIVPPNLPPHEETKSSFIKPHESLLLSPTNLNEASIENQPRRQPNDHLQKPQQSKPLNFGNTGGASY